MVGGHGRIAGDELLQIKGMSYRLTELLGSKALAEQHQGGKHSS